MYKQQLKKILRGVALGLVLASSTLAQNDDGTLLSPNLPLPAPLNLLPISNKPSPAPTPVSAQPQPVVPPAVSKPVTAAPNAPVTSQPAPSSQATSSQPISAPRPVEATKPVTAPTKPVELPNGLVMPISVAAKPTTPATAAKPAAKPVVAAAAPKPAAKPAAKPAPKPVAAKPAAKPPVRTASRTPTSSRSLLTITVKSTAYNSQRSQTDSTPHITATGARTRFGIVALSRDLLRRIPYGSLVRIEDLGSWGNGRGRGRYSRMLSGVNFIVEDTMNIRKRNTVDVWFPTRRAAIQWGARQIRVTVIRYGRR